MILGQIIKEARLKKGLTQEELSSKTDISIRTIQRIENGEVDPRSFTLQSIASALDIKYEDLINQGQKESEAALQNQNSVWLPLIHLSGLFLLLLPPLFIWIWQKDKIKNLNKHGIDVLNFQLSMWIILIPSAILIIPGIFIAIYSTFIIIRNTLRVVNHEEYKYPTIIKFIK